MVHSLSAVFLKLDFCSRSAAFDVGSEVAQLKTKQSYDQNVLP
jgi:hypothetical protein